MSVLQGGWPPVISQIGYPGAGDIDDCWCVATIWAALASDPHADKPTVPEFRHYAGNPDTKGKPNGGDNTDCMQGSRFWHGDPDPTRWEGSWSGFFALVKAGRPASLAVRSRLLPPSLRFGFLGGHRIGVAWNGKTLLVMNPLAKSGANLRPISEADLKTAAQGLLASGKTIAVLFPNPDDLHLRYGGVKSKPYPDRTRTDEPDVNVHSAPVAASAIRTVIPAKGTLWIAYQRTHKADGWWYGNKAGDRWIRGDRLIHEGGTT